MKAFRQTAALVLVAVALSTSGDQRILSADDREPATVRPDKTAKPEKTPPADLKPILDRLVPADRQLVERFRETGKVPEEARDQRVVTTLELSVLGSAFAGSPTNPRFLAVKLTAVNLTREPIALKRSEMRLVADGLEYAARDGADHATHRPIQVDQQLLALRPELLPEALTIAAGASGSTWLLFTELPVGNHVPPLTLKFKLGDTDREIDVNALERAALGMKTERLGPRRCLAVIHISGLLNTINAGTLVEELDRIAADRLVRAAIVWEPGSRISESPLVNWLQNSALNAGRTQQYAEQQFPSVPVSLRELHLAQLPGNTSGQGQSASYPSNFVPVTATVAAQRIHKTDVEAVVSALRSAYEALSPDEVYQAINGGSRLERIAALVGGGGRLARDKLEFLLKFAADPDPLVQQAALVALSQFGEPDAISRLVECARDSKPPVSLTAIAGLAGSRFTAAHTALLELLESAYPETKKNIVRILAAYPRPIWSEAIYESVNDSRSGLNLEALNALVQVGHPKLAQVLAAAIQGPDAALRQHAFNLLAQRADRESEDLALAYLLEQLKTQPPTPIMLQLINRIKDRRALAPLMARFDSTPNKHDLIQTLALIGDEETAKFLVEKYPGLQSHEKGEVLKVLVRFDRSSFRRLAAQALQAGDGGLVAFAVQGLQEDGSPEAVQIMTSALETSPSSFTWSHLANALASQGTPAARAALVKARDSDRPEKRNLAVYALQRMRERSPGNQCYVLAQDLSLKSKWKDAIEQYNAAIQLDPELSDAYAGRGHAYLHEEKLVEAGNDFATAYEQDPYNHMALTGICLVLVLADGKLDEALQKLEADRRKFPNNAIFSYNAACVYGRVYEHLEKNEAAPDRNRKLEQYRRAAMADLKKSVELGFQDFELMKSDPDLKVFQMLPEFQELIKAHAPPEPGKTGATDTPNPRRAAISIPRK
jgi:HEAT repeat protein